MTQEQIRVSRENWQRLNSMKEPGDTFDDVVTELLESGDARDDTADELLRAYEEIDPGGYIVFDEAGGDVYTREHFSADVFGVSDDE